MVEEQKGLWGLLIVRSRSEGRRSSQELEHTDGACGLKEGVCIFLQQRGQHPSTVAGVWQGLVPSVKDHFVTGTIGEI